MDADQYDGNVQQEQGGDKAPVSYSYLPQEDRSDLVKLALSNKDILDELKITLLGLEWDDASQQWVMMKDIEPLLSIRGVNSLIMTILRAYITRDITLSNLTDRELRKRAEIIERDVADALEDNESEWEVKPKNCPLIVDIVGDKVWSMLCRAKDGIERQQLSGSQKTSIIKQESDIQQRTRDDTRRFGIFK